MSDHTPGPWEAADRGDYSDFDGASRVILGDDRRIAVVQHSGSDEDEANTHLLEAAPEMKAALEQAEQCFERLTLSGTTAATWLHDVRSTRRHIRVALRKATP